MQIQFINHASVKFITPQARITTDPWYAGAAFNNRWDLIRTDADMTATASDATHVWLSHERPDHFSIAFFKATANRGLRVLFQKTTDGRVAGFLRSQGFAVDEITQGVRHEFAPDETISVTRCGFYDSWCVLRAGGKVILNLNDCEVNTEQDLLNLKKEIGQIDVLLTQFSYAAWKGGRGNKALRQDAAREKLATVKRQVEILKAKFVIPFASFVYFSHVENSYLNDSINDIPAVLDAIGQQDCKPVIMKPRDIWTVGEAWDNGDALAYWREAYASIASLPLRQPSNAVALPDLLAHDRAYQERVFSKNSKWLIRLASLVPGVGAFQPLTIRLTDLEKTVRFSFFDELRETPDMKPDVEMSSESLDFIFRNDFGYDTLAVNGRFEAATSGFARMTKNFAIGSLNAMGLGLKPSLAVNADVVLLLLGKLRSFLRRMERSSPAAR